MVEAEGVCERETAPAADPFERLAAKEELEGRLEDLRELLPFRHYWVYVLRCVCCMSAAQAARTLGVSTQAVNSIMYRIKKQLRALDSKL